MKVTIQPTRLRGTITPPPSKSQAHRLIIAAALAEGESIISNVSFSQDITATLSCMEQLGAIWERMDAHTIRIQGIGGRKPLLHEDGLPHFDCGESGSTLRFLIPIALAVAGGGVFTGRGRLMERPQKPYFELFDEKGISYQRADGVLTVRGTLHPGNYSLRGDVSSQFFTGLLYALTLLGGPSELYSSTRLESWNYVRMTLETLKKAGTEIAWEQGTDSARFSIPGARLTYIKESVEPDWSQAAFWYAAAGGGNEVRVEGMNPSSLQGDRAILDWGRKLNGGQKQVSIDVSECPDLVPPFAAWGALTEGVELRIENAARLRIKESDRLATVTEVLWALGAEIEELPDGLVIRGKAFLPGGAEVDAHNDHRIAMMAAIASTCCEKSVIIKGADCVKKSYPDFWEDYEALGGSILREE